MREPRGATRGSVAAALHSVHHVTGTNALEVERLTVRFGDTTVLDQLSFAVPVGTSLAVIGPNGAGKTVLFKALIGALPHEGNIRWSAGTKLGYVPQNLDIERDLPLRGEDLLHAKAMVAGAASTDAVRALADVELARGVAALPIGALSGGQFQRLLVAVALVGAPTVLLLDEPTAGVDGPGQAALNVLIERLCGERGMTTLVISHDLSVVYRHANAVFCLGHGRTYFGSPQTVLTPEHLQALYGSPVSFHIHDDEPRP
ncbi:MAG: metal ABC transporter ATP-binding protein [Kofleriaceae bacterium]